MADSFFEEVLGVTLKFSNPNRKDMEDADKTAARLSMSLDGVVRRAVSAGKAVHDVSDQIKNLEPALKKLSEKAGTIGASASAIQSAQRVLSRYTPDRLEKMAEVQASKIAETSGTAALRKELEKNGQLVQRLIATQQGQYERVSRGSNVGRALFVDSETTGLNALKHQIVELTATLFSFNKKTGEIINAAEKTYTGLQAVSQGGRNTRLPSGLSMEQLAGQAISTTMIRRLVQQADFVIAHNAPFDKKFLEKMVPQVASVPWMDSMRGIPWRNLGYNSRAQQDLLRATGINPGSAHRSGSDVSSAIQLLGSRSPLGGGTFLSMLMGNQGPLNSSQQMLASVKQMADEIKGSLNERLGGGKSYDPLSVRYEATQKNYASKAADDVSEMFTRYVVAAVEGQVTSRSRRPATSTDYGTKYGSGQSQETTPGQLGQQAVSLDRRLGTVNAFLRNMAIMSGPASSGQFLRIYEGQSRYQEELQAGRGRGRQIKSDIRSGDELSIATMTGVNTYLHNKREGIVRPSLISDLLTRSIAQGRTPGFERMLTQPWAKGGSFSSSEIDAFIAKNHGNPSSSSIQTAAQMASHVGPGDSRYSILGGILTSGQLIGRRASSAKAAESERAILDRLSSARAGGSPGFKNVISEALKGLKDAGLATAFSAVTPFTSAGGIGGFAPISSIFRAFANRGRTAEPEAESAADIRASMRQDSLTSKLNRLARGVEATTNSFENYRDIVAPIRRGAEATKARLRDAGIGLGLEGSNLSFDAQSASIEARRRRSRVGTQRRLQDIQSGFDSTSSGLGMAELDAESHFETALETKRRRENSLKKSKAYVEKRLSDNDIESMLSGPVRSAQSKLTKAQYAYQASQLTDPAEIDALRAQTASKLALTRYGRGSDPDSIARRDAYASRVQGILGGDTLAQRSQGKASRVAEDQIAKEKELDAALSTSNNRRQLADDKAAQRRTENASKLGSSLSRINDDVAKKEEASSRKRVDSEIKASETVTTHRKREAAILAGGGGGGGRGGSGGSGSGGGAGDDFGSRSGLDFGIGLAAVAAYSSALKNLVVDATMYAARTETLQLVTNQMAKVNGLNTQAVEAQVDAVRSLNITTQEANTTVQKMIFAQLDVAKATTLARVAQDSAIIANVNSSEALDKIILGIVTGQTRVLHNMNLQVSMLQVMRELRAEKKSRGESGDPTELEKRQAMLNKVLLEGAKITGTYERAMLTAGKQYNSLTREAQEAQNAIGKEFLPGFGRVVSLSTQGLRYVQDHGDVFARITTDLVAMGAAASTIGTLSFIKWMMTSPAIPLPAKIVGVGVGLATSYFLNQDKSEANTANATDQQVALEKKISALRTERKRLMDNKSNTDEWKNTWEQNTAALRSASDAQVAINDELTVKLAEDYTKRITDLDNYIKDMQGKSGLLAQFMASAKTSPENSLFGAIMRNVPFLGNGSTDDLEEARRQRAELATKLTNGTGGISAEDLKKKADDQKAQRERLRLLSPTLLNQERIKIRTIVGEMTQADGELLKLDDRLSETGAAGLKARKSLGTPREKAMLDYEQHIAQVKKLGTTLVDLNAKADKGDLAAKHQLSKVAEELGGGNIDVGNDKIKNFLERRNDVIDAAKEDRDIQLSKINRQNQAQILQIREATSAAKIQAAVTEGNYASEIEGINKVFALKQATAEQTKKILGDVDTYNKQIAQNEVDREVALINLQHKKDQAAQKRIETSAVAAGAFNANRILESPISAREAIEKSIAAEMEATKGIVDEEKRKDEQLNLQLRKREQLAKLAFDEKRQAAEFRIAQFDSNMELASDIDRIVSSRGRTNNQRSIDEIERTRTSQIKMAENRFNELQPVTPAADQNNLKSQRDESIMRANNTAASATIKELDQQVENARNRLADLYKQRFERISKINELQATGEAEEAAAAYNTHKMRLEFIEQEYAARGKTIEAERLKSEQIQQAEFDHLQTLLALRKREIDGVRDEAGKVYDALFQKNGGGITQLVQGEFKSLGRKVFQNVAVEYLKDARQVLGGIIPGQETTDANGKKTPTLLGRVLGGTIFSPSHTQDINKLLESATRDNTTAEQDLTKAVRSLDEAVRAASGQAGSSGTSGAGGGGIPSGLPFDIGTLFSGASKNNPFVFNFSGAGSSSSNEVQASTGISNTSFGFGAGAAADIANIISPQTSSTTASAGNAGLPGIPGLPTGVGSSASKNAAGKKVMGAAMIAGGAFQAFQGFSKGGAGGIATGIGGVLTTAAGITSMIPGAQVATPFLMAGALMAGFVGSLLGDSKEKRQKEIDQFTEDHRFIEPVHISREMTVGGNLLGYDKFGMARDTGTGAFPIDVQGNVRRQALNSDSDNPTYVDLPGRVLDNINPPASKTSMITINLPISSMDAKDVLSRSKDIAAAVSKELRLGSDIAINMQQAMFGAS